MTSQTMQQQIQAELTPSRDWKGAIITAGQLIYILGIIYAGAHVFAWTKATLTDFRLFGYIGSVAVILNAIVLPWAIKEWTFETKHRGAAFLFYIIDIVLLAGFVWADTNLARGVTSEAVNNYLTNISPITFINAIITWGTLMILDPENLRKFKIRTAMQEADQIKYLAEALAQKREAENWAAGRINQVEAAPEIRERHTPEILETRSNGSSPKVRASR